MKKNYQKPSMKTVALKKHYPLLVGSSTPEDYKGPLD